MKSKRQHYTIFHFLQTDKGVKSSSKGNFDDSKRIIHQQHTLMSELGRELMALLQPLGTFSS